MAPERWARIDQLLDEAMELPVAERAAFLEQTCADDAELRREVESLLAAHQQAEAHFLQKPALDMAAQQLAGERNSSLPGQSLYGKTLDHYQVLSLLGAGGMGEVYLARDTRLNRQVALKLLPAQFTQDATRIKRFEREARAASALNHPNIITIHDIGLSGNQHFIATEYVEGKTLREMLATGRLTAKEALNIATQICSALSAAHAAGIVHRDIKPENVMLRRDGYAKVLDFGLAKLAETPHAQALTGDLSKTNPGTVLGTAKYMSPEQALGQDVDARSDIFSLGVMLYELLTGVPPFKGASIASTLDAIIHHQPVPLTTVQPDLHDELERILARALEKDRELRYQSADDLRAELKRLQRELDSAATTSLSYRSFAMPAAPKFSSKIIAISAATVAAGLIWWMGWFGKKATPNLPNWPKWKDVTFAEVTENQGIKSHPAIAPDGQWIVYAHKRDGQFDLIRQRVGGSTMTNLTEGSTADDWEPAVSPDGAQIAFRSERNGGGLFVMGSTGENVRLLVAEGHNPAWSPDGSEIAYATQPGGNVFNRTGVGSQLLIFNLKTNTKRHVAAGEDAVQPSWSPNSLRLAYWGLRKGAQRDIWTVALTGGEPIAVTDDKAQDSSPLWSPDGRGLYYASNRNGRLSLWRVPIDESSGKLLGEAEPLQAPSFYSSMLGVSRDGKRMVYSSHFSHTNIKRIAFNAERGETIGASSWMTQSTKRATNQDISRDGQWLTYYMFGDPQFDIFVSKVGEPDKSIQLTNDAHIDRAPRWSPDGKRIAYFSDQTGKYEIWTINADGSEKRQMTFSRDDQPGFLDPAWSRDGTRMLFTYRGGVGGFIMDVRRPYQEQPLFVFPPPPETGLTFAPYTWSPDDRRIAGTLYDKNKEVPGIVLYDLTAQRYERLNQQGNAPAWLPDNRRLLYAFNYKFFLLDSQTKASRELRFSAGDSVDNPSVSADGKYLYYSADDNQESIWMISLK